MFSAKEGVEPQSETVWRQADRYGVPRIAYVNKMDIIGADYLNVVKDMRERLQANAVAIQLPIGAENDFVGIIDIIAQKAYMYRDDLGQQIDEVEIPAEFTAQVEELRAELVEKVAELDEELTMKYLEGEEISVEELKAALRKGVCEVKSSLSSAVLPTVTKGFSSCWTPLSTTCQLRLTYQVSKVTWRTVRKWNVTLPTKSRSRRLHLRS
ncbi:hypothetical protein HMSSN139_57400 [Paenibacillus sp. HMSSN-139]|nr:hypothetical protein HMSSN139_57400 [Paenibacillus sp. HMSSN-139]